MFAMADGSVHAINVSIDAANLGRLADIADGQQVTYHFQ
jgi:hypothetical protein